MRVAVPVLIILAGCSRGDSVSRELVAAHLCGSGAPVLSAASAAEAFGVLQREHIDVLLADIGMPPKTATRSSAATAEGFRGSRADVRHR